MEPSVSIGSPAESKAISDDKSPSESSCLLPPAMLRPCAVRISFRMPFSSRDLIPIEDYRYNEWKGEMHYDDHARYPLDVYTNISSCDIVIHSPMRPCEGGMVVELSCHCQHGDNPRLCVCPDDPYLLSAIMTARIVMKVPRGTYEEVCETDAES